MSGTRRKPGDPAAATRSQTGRGSGAVNVLSEFLALSLRRPSSDAGDKEIAAWYLAKARLHERIAGAGGPDAAQERAHAAAAYEHARILLRPDRHAQPARLAEIRTMRSAA